VIKIKLYKKKNDDGKKGTISSNIHVVICKLLNDRTPVEVAEFNASQIKDENFNMRVSNEDLNFKEEIERKKHYIIELLNYKLELTDLPKDEKIKKVEEKIKSIENDITQIKDGKILKLKDGKRIIDKEGNIESDKINKKDLETDLRHYKVLLFIVSNNGDGSFEIINSNGQREMRFLSHDGIFDPYFYRSSSDNGQPLTMYPDIGLSRKYYKEIDERTENRYLKQQNDTNFFSGFKGVVITVVIVALALGLVIGNIRIAEKSFALDEKLETCMDYNMKITQECGQKYISLLKEGVIIYENVSNDNVNTAKPVTSELQTLD